MIKLHPPVIGHFDVVRLFAPTAVFESDVLELVDRNIAYGVSYGVLFEINSSGLRKQLPAPYPFPDVLARMIRQGARFCISDDSHGTQQIAVKYRELHEYLERYGIDTVYCLTKREIGDGTVTVKQIPNILQHPFWKRLASTQ